MAPTARAVCYVLRLQHELAGDTFLWPNKQQQQQHSRAGESGCQPVFVLFIWRFLRRLLDKLINDFVYTSERASATARVYLQTGEREKVIEFESQIINGHTQANSAI